jgi:hypothetical protein
MEAEIKNSPAIVFTDCGIFLFIFLSEIFFALAGFFALDFTAGTVLFALGSLFFFLNELDLNVIDSS